MENNMQSVAELQPGAELYNGKYVVEKKIGQGGFGITYRAVQKELGREVCIKEFFLATGCVRDTYAKTIHLQGLEEDRFEKYRQAFVKEAQTLATLRHPGIVEVIDIFHENNTSYMVMPFIEGRTLQSIVDAKGPLDYPEAVNYMAQVANAVGYIHERHILHRDIKPDNIIITANYMAILIDFGSAREFEEDKTQAHTSIVTHGYAPSEQYSRTSRKGAYTDIYALGATLYFILTGRVPVEAAARITEPMPEPRELRPDLPEEANRTIMKAMQLKPQDRHQSIVEFMDDLRNVTPTVALDEENPTEVPPPIPPANPTDEGTPKKKSRLPLILGIVFGALLLIGGAVFAALYAFNSNETESVDSASDVKVAKQEEVVETSAETRYVYATHVRMRSSANANTTANVIAMPSYGSEIRIPHPDQSTSDGNNTFYYAYNDSVDSYGNKRTYEGYVASDFLMSRDDFLYLNSILGNANAVNLIGRGSNAKGCGEARYKRALLTYFKRNNYVGNLSDSDIRQLGLDPSDVQRWQVSCRYPESSTNYVYHGDPNNGEIEFAVIIQNTYSGDRKLLCFDFDSYGNVSFSHSEDIYTSGYLYSVYRYGNSVQVYYEQ